MKIIRHPPYSYILLQQEDIFHIHIFFSNKKTSSISIYSSPTRRHHIFFSNKKTYSSLTRRRILLPQEDMSHVHTAYAMSTQHIPCLKSRHMSPEHTYRVHKDQNIVKIQKIQDFDFFSGLKDDLWDVKYYHH